jgi:HPt (histidine-containing phosphotransfer) domain-containing protein
MSNNRISLFQLQLSATEPVDLSALSQFEDPGHDCLAVELIDLYLEQGVKLLDCIREAISKKDWLAARLWSRSLRGSSSNLGVSRMALFCERLEHNDSDDHGKTKLKLLQSLEEEFNAARQILLSERLRRTT